MTPFAFLVLLFLTFAAFWKWNKCDPMKDPLEFMGLGLSVGVLGLATFCVGVYWMVGN